MIMSFSIFFSHCIIFTYLSLSSCTNIFFCLLSHLLYVFKDPLTERDKVFWEIREEFRHFLLTVNYLSVFPVNSSVSTNKYNADIENVKCLYTYIHHEFSRAELYLENDDFHLSISFSLSVFSLWKYTSIIRQCQTPVIENAHVYYERMAMHGKKKEEEKYQATFSPRRKTWRRTRAY